MICYAGAVQRQGERKRMRKPLIPFLFFIEYRGHSFGSCLGRARRRRALHLAPF